MSYRLANVMEEIGEILKENDMVGVIDICEKDGDSEIAMFMQASWTAFLQRQGGIDALTGPGTLQKAENSMGVLECFRNGAIAKLKELNGTINQFVKLKKEFKP